MGNAFMNILLISNASLSSTDNNGKTLLSLVERIPKERVSQLYFHNNLPEEEGYNYFQLSDTDIVKGRFNANKRGRSVSAFDNRGHGDNQYVSLLTKCNIRRSAFMLNVREMLWKKSWISQQLIEWLDRIKPDVILFMAGDCVYAYDICLWIKETYSCRLFTYVTDDYVLIREHESFFERKHREKVFRVMKQSAAESELFFTICSRMRATYLDYLDVDSKILFNRCDSLYDKNRIDNQDEKSKLVFLYAGSIYYGRDQLLLLLASSINKINDEVDENKKRAELVVYTNKRPDDSFIGGLQSTGAGIYGGSLSREELVRELNNCDFPVFVESFDNDQIEKTRLSFSTKIPEYLSLKKPILAIGPREIGSMDALMDASICINDVSTIEDVLRKMIHGEIDYKRIIDNAYNKYADLMSLKGFEEYL